MVRDGSPDVTVAGGLSSRSTWAEFSRFRLLLVELTRREFRARYNSARLGVAWAVLNPLLLMVTLSVVFGMFVRIPVGELPYPVFVLSGLVLWQFIRASIATSTTGIVEDRHIIKKVPFPRSFIPLSVTLANLLNFLISVPLLFILMACYGCRFHWTSLLLPLLWVLVFLCTLGFALCSSVLSVFYRDVRFVIEPVLLVLFYGTPIFYPVAVVPEWLRPWYLLNPFAGIVMVQRELLLDGVVILSPHLAMAAVGTAVLLAVGALAYRRWSPYFADML